MSTPVQNEIIKTKEESQAQHHMMRFIWSGLVILLLSDVLLYNTIAWMINHAQRIVGCINNIMSRSNLIWLTLDKHEVWNNQEENTTDGDTIDHVVVDGHVCCRYRCRRCCVIFVVQCFCYCCCYHCFWFCRCSREVCRCWLYYPIKLTSLLFFRLLQQRLSYVTTI